LHFPPEQEGYLGYAVIIPTLIFIGHSGRALSARVPAEWYERYGDRVENYALPHHLSVFC